MKRFRTGSACAAILACVLVPYTAHAQDATPTAPSSPAAAGVEITPYVAIGSVRASTVGAGISFPIASRLSVESEVGYREGEGHINALSSHVSLLYDLPRVGRTRPYLAAGAGLEQYGAVFELPGSGLVTHPRITLAVNAGGGIKVPVDDSWGMRVDARWFKSSGRSASSEHWRIAHGVSWGPRKR